MRAGERDPAPVAGPVLDAAAREQLVKQAAGKSTRELQQMLAEVGPGVGAAERTGCERSGAGAGS